MGNCCTAQHDKDDQASRRKNSKSGRKKSINKDEPVGMTVTSDVKD